MADDISKDTDKGTSDTSEAPKQSSKPAKKPASNSTKKAVAKPAAKASATNDLGLPQKVDFMWTVAFVVVAFVLGFFIRGLFLASDSGSTISQSVDSASSGLAGSGTSGSGTGGAPPLTEQQLNSSNGQLPTGHPNISGTSTQTAAPAVAPKSGANGVFGNVKSDVPATGDLQPGGQSVTVTETTKK